MKKKYEQVLLILLIILVSIYIIKISKLTGICCLLLSILSPLFFGFVLSWILKPIVNKFKINKVLTTTIIYLLFLSIIFIIIFNIVPLVIDDIKNIYPNIRDYINKNSFLKKMFNNLNFQNIIKSNLKTINNCINNIFSLMLNILYSLIFGFYFLIKKENGGYFNFIPRNLRKNISKDLRLYIKSIILDTLFMFILLSITFFIIGIESPILFATINSVTNIIPYIGPYIGAIPAILVGLTDSLKKGIIILISIVVVQTLENSIIQPLIVSKNVKLNPILILLGLIVFSHFFGILGMIISTPIIIVLRNILLFYKKNKPKWFMITLDKL